MPEVKPPSGGADKGGYLYMVSYYHGRNVDQDAHHHYKLAFRSSVFTPAFARAARDAAPALRRCSRAARNRWGRDRRGSWAGAGYGVFLWSDAERRSSAG